MYEDELLEVQMRILMLVIIIFTVTACSNNEQQETLVNNIPFETIELDQIEDYVVNGYHIVDVREVEEYETGHIQGAMNVPLSVLEVNDFTLLEHDEKYIVICRSGNRSITASNILVNHGYDVVNVREGMSSWTRDVVK